MRIFVVLFLVLLAGCSSLPQCPEGTDPVPARVLRVTAPNSLKVGEMATLTVTVAADTQLCVRRAEGVITSTSGDTVVIAANLLHAGLRSDVSCDCYSGDSINTLVFFTPLTAGNYVFAYGSRDGVGANLADRNYLNITVH